MKSFQVVFPLRFRAGGIPCRRRMLPTVCSDSFCPRLERAPHDPVVTPTRILSRHPHNQFAQLIPDRRPSWISTISRPVKLLRDQSPVPSQNRVRFHHTGDLFQRFSAEPFSDFCQCTSLWIAQPAVAWAAALAECGFPPPGTRSAVTAVGLLAQSHMPAVAPTRFSSYRLPIIAGSTRPNGFEYFDLTGRNR
jgi:hypothetical protein